MPQTCPRRMERLRVTDPGEAATEIVPESIYRLFVARKPMRHTLTQFRTGKREDVARIVQALGGAQGHTHVGARRGGPLSFEPDPQPSMGVRDIDDERGRRRACRP